MSIPLGVLHHLIKMVQRGYHRVLDTALGALGISPVSTVKARNGVFPTCFGLNSLQTFSCSVPELVTIRSAAALPRYGSSGASFCESTTFWLI